MDKQPFKDIIKKYLENELSVSERRQLVEWFAHQSSPDAGQIYDELASQIDELSEADLIKLHKMLQTPVDNGTEKKRSSLVRFKLSPLFLRVAASVLIISALSLFVVRQDFFSRKEPVEYVIKQNGKGRKTKISLPDGSEVWLNVSSKIRFRKSFEKGQRDIWLDGEAFFKVFHNESSPFIVHTSSGLYTRVLGTSFNVAAYAGSKKVQVAVATGVVAVGKGKELYGNLIKDQQLTYNTVTTDIVFGQSGDPAAWMNGALVFNRETIREIAATLERTYNVRLIVSADVQSDLKCTATFSTDQTVEEIIQTLCRLYPLNYIKENDMIKIRKEQIMKE